MASTEHTLKIKTILDSSQIKGQLDKLKTSESGDVDSSFSASQVNGISNSISKLIQALEELPNDIVKSQKTESGKQPVSGSQLGNAKMFANFALGYGVNRFGGSIADLLEAKGLQQAKPIQTALTNIGSGAIAGSAFGPGGAVLGAAIGGVTSAIDIWTDSLKKSKDEIENFNKAIENAKILQGKESAYLTERNHTEFLQQAVERGDIDSLQKARDKAYEKNLTAREAMGQDLTDMLQQQKDLEAKAEEVKSREKKTIFMPSTVTGASQQIEVGDLSTEEVNQQLKEIAQQQESLKNKIKARETALEDAQRTDKEILDIDNAIAKVKSNQLQAEKQKEEAARKAAVLAAQQEAEEQRIIDNQKRIDEQLNAELNAQREEKQAKETNELVSDSDYVKSILKNNNFDDIFKDEVSIAEILKEKLDIDIDVDDLFKDKASVREALDEKLDSFLKENGLDVESRFKKIAERKNEFQENADISKAKYEEYLNNAREATAYEEKESWLNAARKEKENWQSNQRNADTLSGKQDSLVDNIASAVKSLKEEQNSVDRDVNDFSSSYKAGLGIGEVGIDVEDLKQDKLIDVNEVIKDTLQRMQEDQKTLIEVTRGLKGIGLLG